jgi:hypothetical protein
VTKEVVMRRSYFLVVAIASVLCPLLPPEVASSKSPVFDVETVVPLNGGPPSIAVDATARRWIGFAVGNTMQFGVRDEGSWSFETVPFDMNPKTGIVFDAEGSPAVGRWGGSGTLHYVHKNNGQWVSESRSVSYFPEASALAFDHNGAAHAVVEPGISPSLWSQAGLRIPALTSITTYGNI